MRWNHAWLSCQSVPGPPFGGITRIRFKGSVPKQFGALSATRLPRTFFLAQNKTPVNEVNAAYAAHFSMTGSAANLLMRIYPPPAAGFMLVWKMAIHFPFSCFHTVPAL